MKLLTEYLERALQLESLAEGEADSTFRMELLKQAHAYRKLASRRAQQYGLPQPSAPPSAKTNGHSVGRPASGNLQAIEDV